MGFNSISYFLFLPAVYLVYHLVGDRARWWVLLGSSLCFYAALRAPYLLAVLGLVAFSTYCFGIALEHAEGPGRKLTLLWSGVAVNVFVLLIMKYLPFLLEHLPRANFLVFNVHTVKGLIIIGLSYYVLQAVSYLIDIYLDIQKAERHFGYFALYLSFFPKLLQGPIERGEGLLCQLKEQYRFDYDNVRFGLLLFACGLFKKVVVADRLGLFVDTVYGDVTSYVGLPLLIATYAYAFQIYFDFSGYTDMALGSALLFNIKLTPNFNRPYLATSVADFWRRWHMSFSTWILDYIFKPLQMQWRNWKTSGTAAALLATFLISGVWHGASWGFVVWGGLHGFYLSCSLFYKPYRKRIHETLGTQGTKLQNVLQVFCTFNLVTVAWIFFRAMSLEDAWYVLSNMLDFPASYATFLSVGARHFIKSNVLMGHPLDEFIVVVVALASLLLLRNYKVESVFSYGTTKRWFVYYGMLTVIWIFHVSNTQFLYFKF